MRWRSVRAQRSVDRGRAGRVIEPRKLHRSSGCRRFPMCAEGNTAGGVIRESLVGPARSEIPGPRDELHAREPGDLVVAREVLVMPVLDGSRGGRLALGGPRGERLGGHPSMHDRRAKAPLVAQLPHRPRRRRATQRHRHEHKPDQPNHHQELPPPISDPPSRASHLNRPLIHVGVIRQAPWTHAQPTYMVP